MRSKKQPTASPKASATNVPIQSVEIDESAMDNRNQASLQPADNEPSTSKGENSFFMLIYHWC